MAVTSAQVTVSTTAVALNPAETDTVGGTVLWVRNTDATAANGVALGGSGVTAGTGYRVPGATAGTTVGPIELSTGEQLYAIRTGAADVVVDVLRLGS
jgi:hypothetical protein